MDDIKYKLGGKDLPNVREIKKILNLILLNTYKQTLKDGHDWIDKYVPKATGQLRDNLHRHLDSSRFLVSKHQVKIKIGTNIDYASYVNNMSTNMVRHHGEQSYAYYYGHYGKITLNDPQAIGHFYNELLKYLKKRLQLHYNDNLRKYTKVI